MTQHLAHEERVAVGLAIHGMGEAHRGVIEGVTGGGLHERDHAGVVEPGQLDARDAVLSMQRSQRFEATDASATTHCRDRSPAPSTRIGCSAAIR